MSKKKKQCECTYCRNKRADELKKIGDNFMKGVRANFAVLDETFLFKSARDIDAESPPPMLPEEQLRQWWYEQAEREIEGTVPKAVEYSSTDLADIGHVLARTAGRTVSDEEAAELGVFFYLQGKLSRWAGAVAQGKRPSDDTIYDIGVYCRMAQRIRAAGSWPGLDVSFAEQIGVASNYVNRSAG